MKCPHCSSPDIKNNPLFSNRFLVCYFECGSILICDLDIKQTIIRKCKNTNSSVSSTSNNSSSLKQENISTKST